MLALRVAAVFAGMTVAVAPLGILLWLLLVPEQTPQR